MPNAAIVRPRPSPRTSYTPYGNAYPKSQAALAYCGEHRDPITQCYHLGNGHRLYSPISMRFLSPDRLSPFAAGGLNAYAYCLGDPINHRDPSGQKAEDYLLPVLSILTNALGLFVSGLRLRSLYKQSLAAQAPSGAIAPSISVVAPAPQDWALSVISAMSGLAGLTVAVNRAVDPGREWQSWTLIGLTSISAVTTGYEAWSMARQKPWVLEEIELQRQTSLYLSRGSSPEHSAVTTTLPGDSNITNSSSQTDVGTISKNIRGQP